jgi:hypothetical protein
MSVTNSQKNTLPASRTQRQLSRRVQPRWRDADDCHHPRPSARHFVDQADEERPAAVEERMVERPKRTCESPGNLSCEPNRLWINESASTGIVRVSEIRNRRRKSAIIAP